MAGFFIPDPRWEMPELLIPGRKPVGPVEIDWTSKLITKYKPYHIWVFNDYGAVDLVTAKETFYFKGATLNGKDGAHVEGSNNSYIDLMEDSSSLPSSGVTIFLRQDNNNTVNSDNVNGFGVKSTTSTDRLGAHLPYSNGTVYFDHGGIGGNGRITYSGGATGSNAWVFKNGSSQRSIWKNGVRVSNASGSLNRSTTSAAFGLGYHGSNTTNNANQGDYKYMYIFPSMDDADIELMSSDIYQFLIPK
tara:strand:+ start:69 stop:809 length:741 start_codon:yes stop_codon:yes gene_type:complete